MHNLNELCNITTLSNRFPLLNKGMFANVSISTIKACTTRVNFIILVHAAHYIHKAVSEYRYHRII